MPVSESAAVQIASISVGSFSLESLTTGMYENPFHCLREYVQNGLDAIEDARAEGLIDCEAGLITIVIGGSAARPSLTIRDDGTGIPAETAVQTLVSLGASRKKPARHAGFRGIGRLAGIAYCGTLRFTTTAHGEDVATIVEFDCGHLRGAMTPGAEPQDVRDVLASATTFSSRGVPPDDHYTEVEMIGLTPLGKDFADLDMLQRYLRQVCPVSYNPDFGFAERVRDHAQSFGAAIPTIKVEARQRKDAIPILKPFKNSAPISKKGQTSRLRDIEPLGSKEHGWFGWIGLSNFPGEITDEELAGVRFRMKNIQVGDAGLIEDMAEELSATGGRTDRRLMRYAIGEIFITSTEVVPNARRDGFEDNAQWRALRRDVKERISKRILQLVRGASDDRTRLKRITSRIDVLDGTLRGLTAVSPSVRIRHSNELARLLGQLDIDQMPGAEEREIDGQAARVKSLQELLTNLPDFVPPPPPPPPDPDPDPEPDPEPEPESELSPTLALVQSVLGEQLGKDEASRLMNIILARISSAPA